MQSCPSSSKASAGSTKWTLKLVEAHRLDAWAQQHLVHEEESRIFESVLKGTTKMVSTQYEDFFTLVAAAGGRLTESSLSDSLRRFRTVNSHRMDAYVNKIVDVQSELWQKAKRITTGEKLPESMQRICKTYVAATENKSKE